MAKKFDVEAMAKTIPMSFAKLHQSFIPAPDFFDRGAFRHQQDLVRRDGTVQIRQQRLDFIHVGGGGHDELQLVVAVVDPRADDVGLPTKLIVFLAPTGGEAFVRRGVAELGAERGEVARDALGQNGGRRLDGDVFAGGAEGLRKFADVFGDHRLAAGEHAVLSRVFGDLINDLPHGHLRAFGIPRGIHGVAPVAAEVATGGSDEHRRHTRQFALPLNGIKNFRDKHLDNGRHGFGWQR